MIDQSKHCSKVKKGLMVLNKLKASSPFQEPPKNQNANPLPLCCHQPDPEKDIKKFQCQMLSTEDFMLSNADFHVKNLLTVFLEEIDEEDKSKIIESKIKTIKKSQFEFEKNKLIEVFDDDTPAKSKTKIHHFHPSGIKNNSSKDLTKNHSLAALKNKFFDTSINKTEQSKEEGLGIQTTLEQKEYTDISKPTDNNKPVSRIQFSSNQVFEIPGIKGKDKKKIAYSLIKKNKGKSSKNVVKSVNKTSIENSQKLTDRRRFSIPLATQKEIASLTENSLEPLKNNKPTDNIPRINSKKKIIVEDNEGYFRPKTYNTKMAKRNLKEMTNDIDNMNLSYRRFKSKDVNDHCFNKCSSIEEIDILNIKGLSQINKSKLNQICNMLKNNVVGEESVTTGTIIKDTEIKTSTIDDNFKLKSISTVLSEEKNRLLTRKGYVYDSLDDEEIEDEVEGVFYIHPDSICYYIFETIIFLAIMYILIYMPFSLAYDLEFGKDAPLVKRVLDYIVEALFFIDLIIRFFVAYYDFDEILIKKNDKIAIHYLSNWFICDLIAALPFNCFLFLTADSQRSYPNFYNTATKRPIDLISIIRVIKIAKLFDSNRLSVKVQSFFMHLSHFNRWSKIYISLILLLLSIHLLSCIFIFLGQIDYPNWILKQKLDTASFLTIYIASVYYIISSVFTVGYGDIISVSRPERLYNLFLLIVGIMVYSWALSSISTYIQTKDAKTIEFLKKCEILEEIRVTHEKMPIELYDKIQRYLRYRVKHEKKDKSVIFDSLPIGLRNNLIHEMYKPVIDNFIFFKNFKNTDFIVRVILAFKPILGLKNDILVKEGDYIEEIIFVKRGNLSLEIPLPIVVNPESLKKSRYTLSKTISKSYRGNYTFKNTKNLYSLENPGITRENGGTHAKGIHGLEETKANLKSTIQKEVPIATRPYVKILEIRKNEHFGDILMFLNRRSPLCVKVKTKYVEMFFLKKTDAVEISMSYPKIWRTINKKSLFNMEQIDRLIDKALKLFFISNEGQRNLTQTHTSQFIENIMAKAYSYNNNQQNDYPRTQGEMIKLLNDKNNNVELKSIPSCDSRSIIMEESYQSKDYDPSSLIEASPGIYNERNNEMVSITHYHTIEKKDTHKDETSESQSTIRMDIKNKSVTISEDNSFQEDNIFKNTTLTQNKKSQNTAVTPFRFSDINTEIYPNEGEYNFDSYLNTIPINDKYAFSQKPGSSNNSASRDHNYEKDNCNHNRNSYTEKSNDDYSEFPLPFVSRVSKNKQEDDSVDYSKNFKTIKISSPVLSQKIIHTKENQSASPKRKKCAKELSGKFSKKNAATQLSLCENMSFTINSLYGNINEMNNYNTPATKGLLSAIMSMNIGDIDKSLKRCNFGTLGKYIRRTSLSFTSISLNKKNHDMNNTIIRLTPFEKSDSFLEQNEDIKATMSDRIQEKKLNKSKSINIGYNQTDSMPFLLRDMQTNNQNPIVKKRISVAKFKQTKDNFLNKSPSIINTPISNNSNKHIQTNPTMYANSLFDHTDKSPQSPNKRQAMSPLKQARTLAPLKKDLLNVISENIEKNSQNLNNPELFYLEYFQKIMNKNNDLKEQHNLYKRLEDTEKYLMDSVRKTGNNNT